MAAAMALLLVDVTVCKVVGRLDDCMALNSVVEKDYSLVVLKGFEVVGWRVSVLVKYWAAMWGWWVDWKGGSSGQLG
jgi:hypothetical protein